MTVHLALNEPAQFTVGGGIEDFYWVETGHSDPDEVAQGFQELKRGIPRDDYAIYVQQFRADTTRVPEGKPNMQTFAFLTRSEERRVGKERVSTGRSGGP